MISLESEVGKLKVPEYGLPTNVPPIISITSTAWSMDWTPVTDYPMVLGVNVSTISILYDTINVKNNQVDTS